MPEPVGEPTLRALLVDWGGVLTEPLQTAIAAWAGADGVPVDDYVAVIREWLGVAQGELVRDNPVRRSNAARSRCRTSRTSWRPGCRSAPADRCRHAGC